VNAEAAFTQPATKPSAVCESAARREARCTKQGEFVPLDKQDTALWSAPMIDEAKRHLRLAASFERMAAYSCEPEESFGNRRIAGRNPRMTAWSVKVTQ
jgi:hypothetical protein